MAQNTTRPQKLEPVHALLSLPRLSAFVLCTLTTIATGTIAHADTYRFSTPSGSTILGLPVDADALFKIDNGSLLVTVSNNQANPRSDNQVLVDVTFQVLQDGGLFDALLVSETAPLVNITSSTSHSAVTGPVNMNWVLASNGTDFGLCDNPGSGSNQGICSGHRGSGWPGNGLIGYGTGIDLNVYSAANSSIAGNAAHNPYYYHSADFQITSPSLTSRAVIQNVKFFFGGSSGNFVTTPDGLLYATVPEPGPPVVVLVGLLIVGMTQRLRSTRR